MNFAQKARAAALGGFVVILLAGCAGSPSAGAHPATDGATTKASSAAQAQPDARKVKALEVVDPVTIVVTPIAKTDSLYGKDFTVRVNDIVAPAKGQCGYDQALDLSKSTLIGHTWVLRYEGVSDGVFIDQDGDHHGALDSTAVPYAHTMITEGMAIQSTHTKYPLEKDTQAKAKADAVGLYKTCPGFGA